MNPRRKAGVYFFALIRNFNDYSNHKQTSNYQKLKNNPLKFRIINNVSMLPVRRF